MNRETESIECSDEAAQLLPWFVNRTLPEPAAARVAAHLAQCAACRAGVAAQERVQALLRAPTQVDHTPQAGYRRLVQRIDAQEGEAQASTPAVLPARARSMRDTARGPVRWLAAAVVVQAVALGAMVAAFSFGNAAPDTASYHTLTTPGAEGARLRVVFAPATTLAELQDLLHANQLRAIAGPSEAGIFTLALPASLNGTEAQRAVLARLRADPRVRFAELLGAESATR